VKKDKTKITMVLIFKKSHMFLTSSNKKYYFKILECGEEEKASLL